MLGASPGRRGPSADLSVEAQPVAPPPTGSAVGWLLALLACQLAGEVAARALLLPLPGPVIGMALLLAALLAATRRGAAAPEGLARVTDRLLSNLGLLFVPAGVGVLQSAMVVQDNLGAIALAILISTPVGLAVTAAAFAALGPEADADASGEVPPPSATRSLGRS